MYTTVITEDSITGYYNNQKIGTVKTSNKVENFGENLLAYIGKSSYPDKFYKGGASPEGIGFLFTIYTQRREGRWMTELRFGAFHKIKK